MVNIPPVSRAEIDAWPIAEAGVPARIVNCATAAGWRTVGALRGRKPSELMARRSFGRTSLRQWRAFIRQCDRLERGELAFENVRDVFESILDRDVLDILTQRYRFDEPGPAARRRQTLRDIGRRRRLTRERVRQIQEIGLHRLRGRLVRCCLEPFCRAIESHIRGLGGTATFDDLAPLSGDLALGGMNPTSLVLLMHDLFPERCFRLGLLFSVLPIETLEEAERQAIAAMEQRDDPMNLDDVLPHVTALAALDDEGSRRRSLRAILERSPEVLTSRDDRYFAARTARRILTDILRVAGSAAPCTAITAEFNRRLADRSRRSSIFVARRLRQLPGATVSPEGFSLATEAARETPA